MGWIYLLLAGVFEIGWPVGIKIYQAPETRWIGFVIAADCLMWQADCYVAGFGRSP